MAIESSMTVEPSQSWVSTSVIVDGSVGVVWNTLLDLKDIKPSELGFSITNLIGVYYIRTVIRPLIPISLVPLQSDWQVSCADTAGGINGVTHRGCYRDEGRFTEARREFRAFDEADIELWHVLHS